MRLSHLLANTAGIVSSLRQQDGVLVMDVTSAEMLVMNLHRAAAIAFQMEKLAESADVVAFAKEGEPRPSAEVHDLSEILQRERSAAPQEPVGRSASGTVFTFPTRPGAAWTCNGGDVA